MNDSRFIRDINNLNITLGCTEVYETMRGHCLTCFKENEMDDPDAEKELLRSFLYTTLITLPDKVRDKERLSNLTLTTDVVDEFLKDEDELEPTINYVNQIAKIKITKFDGFLEGFLINQLILPYLFGHTEDIEKSISEFVNWLWISQIGIPKVLKLVKEQSEIDEIVLFELVKIINEIYINQKTIGSTFSDKLLNKNRPKTVYKDLLENCSRNYDTLRNSLGELGVWDKSPLIKSILDSRLRYIQNDKMVF